MSQIKLKTSRAAKPRRRRLWLYMVVGLTLLLLGLAATVYVTLTSNTFFQAFVVPKLSAALNAEVKVGRAIIHPSAEIRLEHLQVTSRGHEPLLTAQSAAVRASLWSFLRGQFKIEDIHLVRPSVTIVEYLNGSRNLDPVLRALAQTSNRQTSSSTNPSDGLEILSLRVTDGRLQLTKQLLSGGQSVTALEDLQLTANELRNGGTGQARLQATVHLENTPRASAPPHTLRASLAGDFHFALNHSFQPETLTGQSDFTVGSVTGNFAEFQDFTAHLKADVIPAEIKSLVARFTRSGQPLGEIQLSGPLDLARREAKLKLDIANLGSHVFNLLGAHSGLDFGDTVINASSELDLGKNGTLLSLIGELTVAQLRATRDGQSTPVVNLKCNYSLAVDQTAKSALLGAFTLTGTQNEKPLLRTGLTSPMTLAWGDAAEATGDATLLVSLSDLNLADWQPLFGNLAPAGQAKLEARFNSQQTGRVLTYDFKFTADNLTLRAGEKQLTRLAAQLEAAGEARDLQQFKVNEINGQMLHRGKPTLSLNGQATHDRPQAVTTAEFTVLSSVSDLIPALDLYGADATAGALEFTIRYRQQTNTQTYAGSLRVAGLSGMVGDTAFLNYSTDVAFELTRNPRTVQLRRFTGRIHEGSRLGGTFTLTGNYDRYTSAGELALRMADINQHGLRPYLESVFGNRRVSAMSFNATAIARRDAAGDATFKSEVALTNLVTIDLKTAIATAPLEFRAHLDAGLSKQVAQINRGRITLTPTPRSTNILTLTGRADLTAPEAITGQFKLAAETLDLTRYMDLFGPKPPATRPTAPTPTHAAPDTEPEALNLPYRNFVCELNIGRLYAREVDAAELAITATLDRNQFYLRPCQVTVNGAGVSATASVDLGEPGYRYDVAFNARELALAPLVNSFQPERKGQISGIATLTAQFKGAGIREANLQENLDGQLFLSASSLNLALGNVRSPVVKTLANTVVGVPDLLRNPGITLENLVGRYATFGPPRATWAADLMDAPLQSLEARVVAGGGQVRLEQAEVRSGAFRARASGNLTPNTVLTNSILNAPVSLAVNHGLASKIGLIPAGAPNDASYYAMPNFLKLTGTLGRPETEVNSSALFAVAANASPGLLKQLGINTSDRTRSLIQTGGGAEGNASGGKRKEAAAAEIPAFKPSPPKVFDLFGAPQ